MKILIGVHHFPPSRAAGAELRAYRTAKWLRTRGHDARVVCIESITAGPDNGLEWQNELFDEIEVRRLSFDIHKIKAQFYWEFDNPWIEQNLKDYLQEFRPDIFHLISGYLMGAGALKAAYSMHIPVVITITDFWFLCPRLTLLRPDGKLSDPTRFDAQECTRCKYEEKRRYRIPASVFPTLADLFWKLLFTTPLGGLLDVQTTLAMFEMRNTTLMQALGQADAIVCPSKFLVETLRSRGAPTKKLILNTHGLDTSSWLPILEKPIQDDKYRIGYIGQICEHKGVHLLIHALPHIQTNRELEILIYGDDQAFPDYAAHLKSLAKGDPRIKFMRKYSYPETRRVLSPLDVVVIPSLWNEIGPWVLFEAYEMRKPVIASNIPNMSYVIKDEENGLLFDRGDPVALARQIQKLIEQPGVAHRLVANTPPVKSIDEELLQLLEIYQGIVQPQSTSLSN